MRRPADLRAALAFLMASTCSTAACGAPEADAASGADTEATVEAPGPVIDSVLPMDVALDRFRADLEEPITLESGDASRDALVRRVVDALAASDTAAFEALAVDRAEWAWLYYPTTTVAQPPYELPPALAWFQLQEGSRRGVGRALRELGGHAIELRGYACAAEPIVEGPNRTWTDCRVTLTRDGGEPVTLRLFGSILERDGRFTVLSFVNDF